ncbi:ROK family transcriptional regulator [Sporomusa aerivorans]|uniref:ROK family transcriptional regulator n=1 Tax=Sporomusa aerivorans TaxID=204936 RepID=UPI00352AAF2D
MALPADMCVMPVLSPNEGQILNIIRRHGPVSRAEIARSTGLTPPTVATITNKLIDAQLVMDNKIGESSGGRRPLLLTVNPAAGQVIIIHIRSFKMIGYVVDAAFGVHFEHTVSIRDCNQAAVLDLIQQLIDECRYRASLPPQAIGVVVRGPVRVREGISVFAPNIGWKNVPLKYIIEEKNRLPVFVENDANILAYGEYYFGEAKDANSLVLLKVAHGIGGGIMFNGALYRGITGSAGEVGHTVIDMAGPLCSCGNNGCMEAMASETALIRLVAGAIQNGQFSIVDELVKGNLAAISPEDIYQAADDGDALALEMLSRVAGYLGIGIANLVNVFNPELVVISGGLAKAKRYIEKKVWETVDRRSFESCSSVLEIRYSTRTSVITMKGSADMAFSILAAKAAEAG